MTSPIGSGDETPVYFPAGGEELFGVFTRAHGGSGEVAVLMLSGGAWTPSPGRNRIWVRLARTVAARGLHAMRVDYRGVGESTGVTTMFVLDEPFVDDVEGATRWLEGQGISKFVLVGTCFGARTALAAAAKTDGVRAVALLAVPTRDFKAGERLQSLPTSWYVRKAFSWRTLSRLRDPKVRSDYRKAAANKARWAVSRARGVRRGPSEGFNWVSPQIVGQLGVLADRQVPVLLVYGADDDFYADFCRGRPGPLGKVLDRAGDLFQLRVVEGKMHGLTTGAVQEHALRYTEEWLAELGLLADATLATQRPEG